jgi:chromatin structure-remodeling complex subunit RSC9
MWTHIVEKHLEVPRDPDNPRRFKDGLVKDTGRKFACLWTGCTRFRSPGIEDAHKVSMHVKVHLTDSGANSAMRKYSKPPSKATPTGSIPRYYRNTPVDEHGHPVGLPLSALLVLRNLARQMLKIESKDMRGRHNLIEQHFGLHQQKIADAVTFNWSLRHYTPEFMQYVSKGMDMAHKLPRLSNGSSE